MSKNLTTPAFLLAAALASVTPAGAAGDVHGTCYVDWSDAAPIVVREQLATVRDMHAEARARYNGDLVRATLCEEGSHFTYRLLVRDSQGRISGITVDAKKPFVPAGDRR
jgi:hypothetical protein